MPSALRVGAAHRSAWLVSGRSAVVIDTDKIDEAVGAAPPDAARWSTRLEGHDWDALDRVYRKGMIDNPVSKAKSVVLTDEGLAESERLFRKLFERAPG